MQPSRYLFPLSFIYDAATRFRNFLYDRQLRKSVSFDLPVINVGNLTAGGTGKTPHVAWLITNLKAQYKLAVISRGYGRGTKGFILADANSTARQIGDEPMLYHNRYGRQIAVCVCEERVPAVPALLGRQEDTEVILLDDAYQHRAITPGLNILLSDYNRPFYADRILPAGYLREHPRGAARADIAIITKCPADLSATAMQQITGQVHQYLPKKRPVFFTTYRYGQAVPFSASGKPLYKARKVWLLSGIARSDQLLQYVKRHFNLVGNIALKDHVRYTPEMLQQLAARVRQSGEGTAIITTEKDAVKLMEPRMIEHLPDISLYFLPIEVQFLKGEKRFAEEVNKYISAAGTVN